MLHRGNDWYRKDFVDFIAAKLFWPCEYFAQRQSGIGTPEIPGVHMGVHSSPQALKEACVFKGPCSPLTC